MRRTLFAVLERMARPLRSRMLALKLAAGIVVAGSTGFAPLSAQFNGPEAVTSDSSGFSGASIACDSFDNVAYAFTKDGQIYFATSVLGLGVEIPVTNAPGTRAHPRIVEGGFGFLYLVFDEASTAAGASGSDIVLTHNLGGPFGDFDTLASALDDEAYPAVALGLFGAAHVAWQRTPAAGVPEIYLSADRGPEEFVAEGTAPAIASTSDGAVHLVYVRDGDAYYRRYDAGSFDAEVALADVAAEITGTAIAVGSADSLHVVCTAVDSLEYVSDDGSGFTAPASIASVAATYAATIAARASGEVAVAYATAGGIYALEQEGGAFGSATAVTPAAVAADAPAICIDSLGYVHIAYEEAGAIYRANNVPAPTADFSADVLAGEAPLEVAFLSLASGVVDETLWDFGDGTTSDESNPVHVYTASGPKSVTLTVTGPGGSATETKSAYIDVLPATHILKVPLINVFAGEQDVLHPILATNAEELQGFQVVIGFDFDVTPIESLTLEGSLTESEFPEFVITEITPNGADSTLVMAVILDVAKPFTGRVLRAGTNSVIASMEYSVPIGLSVGDESAILFLPMVGSPPIFNVFNAEDGSSILPLLVDGGITVSTIASTTFLRGDMNLGGTLDLADAIAILVYLFASGSPPQCLDAADVNDSGNIDIADPISLLTYLFFNGASPPYPFPGEGLDSTADGLGDC